MLRDGSLVRLAHAILGQDAKFSELLRGSEPAADGSFPALIAVLERVAAAWPHDAAVSDLLRLARAAPGLSPAP